jgi:type II secretory pathway component PulK
MSYVLPCGCGANVSKPGRRGFALPMVLLLVLIAGIVVSAMLQRHVTQVMTTQREALQYTFHHASKGAQEAIEAWLRQSGATRNMQEAVEADGHAFDLTIDGMTVKVSLFDAQDGVLIELAGLSGTLREAGLNIIDELRTAEGAGAVRFTRREGPLAVSVNSAPREVLLAAVNAITDGVGSDSLVAEVLHAREEGTITQQTLNEVYTQADVEPEIRNKLGTVLTAQTTLWRVVAEAQDSSAVYTGRPNRRFCGLVMLTGTVGASPRDRAAALQRNSLIISWEDCTPNGE